ncbi:MAG: T9SS type A sorting domain-containing protein [Candidatus Sabulitectum sp.]|nr:T9SS type A sorting domain-containing protein [Candidatus Sabulitectum sp.]
MGWFDHDWVEVEESSTSPVDTDPFVLQSSANPFAESVTITVQGAVVPVQLMVYDFSGRIVRTISSSSGNTFLWDGCDSEGTELPAGTYSIRGTSAGITTTTQLVKL